MKHSYRLLARLLLVGLVAVSTAGPRMATAKAPVDVKLENCAVQLIDRLQVAVPAKEQGILAELYVKMGEFSYGIVPKRNNLGAIVRKNGQPVMVENGPKVLGKVDTQLALRQMKVAHAEWVKAKNESESTINRQYAEKASLVAKATLDAAVGANQATGGTFPAIVVKKYLLDYERSVLQIEQADDETNMATLTERVKAQEFFAAEESIGRHMIYAAIPGIVVGIARQKGEWIKPGEAVFRIIGIQQLRVQGFVKISDYRPDQLKNKKVTVVIDLASGEKVSVPGKVTFIHPEVLAGKEYRVWAEIDNPEKFEAKDGTIVKWPLRPKMHAQMTIHTDQDADELANK